MSRTALLDGVLLASILILAGYLRFAQLDLAELKLDEARALLMATKILEEDPLVTMRTLYFGWAGKLAGVPISAGDTSHC